MYKIYEPVSTVLSNLVKESASGIGAFFKHSKYFYLASTLSLLVALYSVIYALYTSIQGSKQAFQ